MIKTAVAASEPGRAASSRDPRTRNFAGRARPRLAAMPPFAWLVAAPAQAGVEFVTEAGGCSKVDTIGDGKDLRLSNAPVP